MEKSAEWKIYTGDALRVLKAIPDETINTCVTSPPYYGLRNYGVDSQIGLEDTPEQFIENLVAVFREVRRVLRSDGTLWVNIGDSYAGSRKGGANYPEATKGTKQGTNRGSTISPLPIKTPKGMKPKDLMGIPWMLAFALRADGWYLRQDIIWEKVNPMPESVTDRCTKSHEYIFLLSKSQSYYFDHMAMQERAVKDAVNAENVTTRYGGNKYTANPDVFNRTKSGNAYHYTGFRNKRDVWTVSIQPYSGAHFATFPEKLIEPCILAGCPDGGVVLDPFNGSGTTGVVSIKNDRNYVGIELNPEYVEMSEKRIADAKERVDQEKAQCSLFEESFEMAPALESCHSQESLW